MFSFVVEPVLSRGGAAACSVERRVELGNGVRGWIGSYEHAWSDSAVGKLVSLYDVVWCGAVRCCIMGCDKSSKILGVWECAVLCW